MPMWTGTGTGGNGETRAGKRSMEKKLPHRGKWGAGKREKKE